MTKAELIDRIARSRDLPPDVTKKCIAEILDIAFDELSTYFIRAKITRNQTPRFTMPGFGTFTKKRRAPRKGVNPQTLEPMEIPGYDTLDFKPGSELKQALANSRGARAAKSRGKAKSSASAAKRTARGQTKKATAKRKSTSKRSTKAPAKKAKTAARKTAPIGGRRLRRRDELEYAEFDDVRLPEAPLQRSRGRKRRKIDVDSTG